MLFELSRHLDDCTSLTSRQELDLLMQPDDQNIKPGVDSLTFVMAIHTLQTYLGVKLIKKTLKAHSLAGKNTLLINHIKCLFRAPGALI